MSTCIVLGATPIVQRVASTMRCNAIDDARRIFGRITSYTIYRVALTMDIMFVLVLSSIFAPLTAMMIVLMSLLDDVRIMTIAYDNTPVSDKPIRWRVPRLLSISAMLGLFSVVETFGLLLIGIRVLPHPRLQDYFGRETEQQLQTIMFLQLVAGGHLYCSSPAPDAGSSCLHSRRRGCSLQLSSPRSWLC